MENDGDQILGNFLSMLTVLFIGLKLTGFIDWSWWLVLSPILLPIGLVLIVLVVWGIGMLIKIIIGRWRAKRTK
jgi:phosphoglycerol transferase MdoB-like AlkP superfamily enzyme